MRQESPFNKKKPKLKEHDTEGDTAKVVSLSLNTTTNQLPPLFQIFKFPIFKLHLFFYIAITRPIPSFVHVTPAG